jgi:hypothetical protein
MDNLMHNVAVNALQVKAGGGEAAALPLSWGDAADIAGVKAHHVPGTFDIIVGTDVVFAASLVAPLLATIHTFSHATTRTFLCLQERCAAAHKELLATASDQFVLTDRSARLPLLEGCGYAKELECHLFELIKRPAPASDVGTSSRCGARFRQRNLHSRECH